MSTVITTNKNGHENKKLSGELNKLAAENKMFAVIKCLCASSESIMCASYFEDFSYQAQLLKSNLKKTKIRH